jgi:hypothetical protein
VQAISCSALQQGSLLRRIQAKPRGAGIGLSPGSILIRFSLGLPAHGSPFFFDCEQHIPQSRSIEVQHRRGGRRRRQWRPCLCEANCFRRCDDTSAWHDQGRRSRCPTALSRDAVAVQWTLLNRCLLCEAG